MAAFLYATRALKAPAFAFPWLQLVADRRLMPRLLGAPGHRGWGAYLQLILVQLRFLEPFLRNAELTDAVRLLYKGTLRVLLLLLHDFPEFLCEFHFHLCDLIPPSCIQVRCGLWRGGRGRVGWGGLLWVVVGGMERWRDGLFVSLLLCLRRTAVCMPVGQLPCLACLPPPTTTTATTRLPQMRNLVLSAFPRAMRLPDPFTPNLKVDLLPEIAAPPRFVPSPDALLPPPLRAEVDAYLAGRPPPNFLMALRSRLTLSPSDALVCGTKFSVPLINALAFYLGIRAVEAAAPQPGAAPAMATPHMELFHHLLRDLDTGGWVGGRVGGLAALVIVTGGRQAAEPALAFQPALPVDLTQSCRPFPPPPPSLPAEGRYLLINALANHLRFPNAHTHYFSCALLSLFTEAGSELVQEQITRVLLERLIVNRCVGLGVACAVEGGRDGVVWLDLQLCVR